MSSKDLPLTEAFFYILLAVRHPNHGYGITQEVGQLTDGRLILGAGTLYGAVQTLLERGWIKVWKADTESRKKKEYLITEEGRSIFYEDTARLKQLTGHAALMEEVDL